MAGNQQLNKQVSEFDFRAVVQGTAAASQYTPGVNAYGPAQPLHTTQNFTQVNQNYNYSVPVPNASGYGPNAANGDQAFWQDFTPWPQNNDFNPPGVLPMPGGNNRGGAPAQGLLGYTQGATRQPTPIASPRFMTVPSGRNTPVQARPQTLLPQVARQPSLPVGPSSRVPLQQDQSPRRASKHVVPQGTQNITISGPNARVYFDGHGASSSSSTQRDRVEKRRTVQPTSLVKQFNSLARNRPPSEVSKLREQLAGFFNVPATTSTSTSPASSANASRASSVDRSANNTPSPGNARKKRARH